MTAKFLDLPIAGAYVSDSGKVEGDLDLDLNDLLNVGVLAFSGSDVTLSSPAANTLLMSGSAFDKLQFGGTTSAFPMLKRNNATVYIRLADDSDWADTYSGGIHADGRGYIVTPNYGVGMEYGAAANAIIARTAIQAGGGYFFGVSNTAGRANFNYILGNIAYYNKNHDHSAISADPTFFIHSETDPDTDNTQWLSLTHDQADGVINTGSGSLKLGPNNGNILLSGSSASSTIQFGGTTSSEPMLKRNGTYLDLRLADDSGDGRLNLRDLTCRQVATGQSSISFGISTQNYGVLAAKADDGVFFGINVDSGRGNNNLIIAGAGFVSRDFDHDTDSINPTVFVQSATDPDTDNTQWLSLTHNQTNAVLTSGTGSISLVPESGYMDIQGNIAKKCEGYLFENTTVTTIDTADEWHFISLTGEWTQGICNNGLLMQEGVDGSITVFADGGGGLVTVTSVAHGLSDGDWISITGTTSYNGIFEVQNKTDDTFQITDTWVADDGTGTLHRSAGVEMVNAVDFEVSYGGSFAPAVNNHVFDFGIFINGTLLGSTERRNTASSAGAFSSNAGAGFFTAAAGDFVSYAVKNVGNSGNIVFRYLRAKVQQV